MATETHTERLTPADGNLRRRFSVGAGETTPWYPVSPAGGMVGVLPGGGGTMSVQGTSSPLSVVLADNANATSNAIAETWASGTVSAAKRERFAHTTAVRFVATTAAGTGEIAT